MRVHDVAELEHEAKQSGVLGAMAKAQLRLLRGVPPDGLLPLPPERKDGRGGVEGQDDASGVATRSTTSPAGPVAGHSVSGALLDRIDQLLAMADGHA